RAALWQTNLTQVLKSLTGLTPDPAPQGHYGWSLKKHHAPNVIELSRAGDWIIFGAANDFNGLITELTARTQRSLPLMTARNAGDWLEADLDPGQLAEFFSLSARAARGEGQGEVGSTTISSLSSQLLGTPKRGEGGSTINRFYFSVTGNGTNV